MDTAIKKSKVKKNTAIKDSRQDKIYYVIVNVALFIFTMLILLPLINIVASSFSDPMEVNRGHVLLWPVKPCFEGYKAVFEYPGIWRAYGNTFAYTIVGTMINLAMTMMCAYPMARKGLPLKGVVMGLFTFTMYFSGGMIPNYILIRDLGMMNSFAAMVIPGAISVYNMIIARTFIMNIPDDIEEAAKIDGCSDIYYFWKMVLPLSKTVIAVLGLYYAVGHWNDYFTAFLYLNSPEKMPLQIRLREILINNQFSEVDAGNLDETSLLARQARADLLKYALIIVSSVPVLILYPFVKKHFLKGVMLGALKG